MIYPGGEIDIEGTDAKVNTSFVVLRVVAKHGKIWMAFFSFIYAGEPYDYALDLGLNDAEATEQDAREEASSRELNYRARHAFLRDVDLKVRH